MTIEFDEKGKFFTDVILKDPVFVTVQTETHIVQGYIHVRHDDRIKDTLNQADQFVAVTDAELYNDRGELLYRSGFLAINKNKIVWIIPQNEGNSAEPSSGSEH